MPSTVGPRSILDRLAADLGMQAAQPLLDDAERQRQQIGQQPAQPSFSSMIPSLEALTGQPAVAQQPQSAPQAPQQAPGGFLAGIPGLDSLLGTKPAPATSSAQTPAGTTSSGSASTMPYGAPNAAAPGAAPLPSQPQVPAAPSMPGVDDGDDEAYIRQAAAARGIDPDIAVRVANSEGGAGNNGRGRQNLQGAPAFGHFQDYIGGPSNPGLGDEMLEAGIDPRDPNQARRAIDYSLDHAAKNGWGAFQGAARVGIGDRDGIGTRNAGGVPSPSPAPVSSGAPAAGAPQQPSSPGGAQASPDRAADLYPRQDLLDDPDKWSVCGPLGVMAFGAMTGHPVDYQTAKEAARKAGWTPQRGMAGPSSQVAALRSLNIAAKEGPVDLATITREVRNGNPVGLSSPGASGHYFTVQGVDDQGRLDLGNSALSLRASGGRRWFTLDELRQMGVIGAVDTAIYIDNPASPTPSVAAQPDTMQADAMSFKAPLGEPADDVGSENGGDMGPPAPSGYQAPVAPFQDAYQTGDQPWTNPASTTSADSSVPLASTSTPPDSAQYAGASQTTGVPGLPSTIPSMSDTARTSTPTETVASPQLASGADADSLPPQQPLPPQTVAPSAYSSGQDDQGQALPVNVRGIDPSYAPTPNQTRPEVPYNPNNIASTLIDAGSSAVQAGRDAAVASNPLTQVRDAFAPEDEPVVAMVRQKYGDTMAELLKHGLRVGSLASIGLKAAVPSSTATDIYNAVQGEFGDKIGRAVGSALGLTDDEMVNVLGVPVSGKDVAGLAGQIVLDPTNLIGAGEAKAGARAVSRAAEPLVQAGRQAVEQGTEALGRAGQSIARDAAGRLLDMAPQPGVMQGDRGIGRALVDTAEQAAPPPHVYSPEAPEGSVRRYHGTAGAFDAADPMRFDNDGLYGPGYYTTSDPRVANSYADARQPVNPRAVAVQQMIEDVDARLDSHSFSGPAEEQALKDRRARLQQQLGDVEKDVQSGPNVRPVDLPSDLNMLNLDDPLTPDTMQRVRSVVGRIQRAAPEIAGPITSELDAIDRGLAQGIQYQNEALVNTLMDQARLLGPTIDGYPGGKKMMTDILERAGFDGINHQGGHIRPILDDAGNAVKHDVSIVFPGSVNKARNALSGTEGGAFLPFDPASAAAGAAAGASSEDENGEQADPLRTAAGMFIGALGGTPQGRKMAAKIAQQARKTPLPSKPPNLLELAQGARYSWGMLGNFATGAVNAMGAPVEIAMGLPSEAFRMGVIRQMPAPVIYQAVALLGGVKQGVRDMLGTAIGQVPNAVRNSPDFRPPLNERMQGAAGKALGHVIEVPGRLTSQVPDAFWAPVMRRWGEAKAAGDLMYENGVSKLRPDEQIKEMQRLLSNPTREEAARIDAEARAFAEEMTYKGDAGFLENKVGGMVRSGKTPATASDPMAEQVYDALGSFVMPFFSTVWKLHKTAASRVPGAGFVTNRSLPWDEKVSRQVVGAGLGLYLADRASQGMITGPGPSDPDEAALVNKDMPAHSTYIPSIGWVPNDWFGSAGPYLNAIGGYYDARRYATDKEKADPDKMGERIAKDVMRGFERFPVAQAVQSLVAMAESPTKGVTDFLSNAGSSFVPAPVKTGLASQDPLMRTTDREAGFLDQIGQKLELRTGIMRQELPVQQDRFGRDVPNERQGAAAFGLNVKQAQDDPVARALIAADVYPGAPKKEVSIPKPQGTGAGSFTVPLTSKEQRAWNTARGRKLLELASPKVNDPAFQALPIDRQQANYQKLLELAGQQADAEIKSQIGGPEITRRVRQSQEQKKAS